MIDTGSEPGAWADAMRFPPFVDDSGVDDNAVVRELNRVKCLFQARTIAAVIGAPDHAFQSGLDAVEGGHDARPAVCVSLHAEPIATVRKDNPHGR